MDSTTDQPANIDHSKLNKVHITPENVMSFELTPPHPPREDTPEYRASHHKMVVVDDLPCAVCRVRNSTLKDPLKNRYNATCLETHHYPIERSLADACDPAKIMQNFPQVHDKESLNTFIDSEQNLIVLCDLHHRSVSQGIHHMTAQDFAVLPYIWDNYQVVAKTYAEANAALAANDVIEKENGYEL